MNAIKTAIQKIGGPTRAACDLRVSSVTIHDWVKSGKVKNFDKAKLLADLSGVSVDALRGEPETIK